MSRVLVILCLGFAALVLWAGFRYWSDLNGSEFIARQPSPKSNLISVTTPKPNDLAQSPFVIEGEARGTWFFEADFPVYLYDGDGTELGVAIAQAQGEWMTPDFVPFRALMQFRKPKGTSGTLIFKKNNPSGLPEHDDELKIPVRFW